jgi:hypothetical protein
MLSSVFDTCIPRYESGNGSGWSRPPSPVPWTLIGTHYALPRTYASKKP